jgi:uncharacterized protein involved in exopolysaccharide biosynthesis
MKRTALPNVSVLATPDTGAPPAIPVHFMRPGISLMQVGAILRSYWRQSVIIALSAICLSLVVIALWPKSYTATATLIVNPDNKDPLAGQEYAQGVLSSYAATQAELMLSPIVLSPVVDQLKLTEDDYYTDGFHGNGPAALHEYVQRNLRDNLEVEPGKGGQLLYLSATDRNPARAAEVANAVADRYQSERRRVDDPAGERAGRYSEQLAQLRAKATAAQDKLTEWRKRNGVTEVTTPNGQATANTDVQALDLLEQRLLDAQNTRRSLESKESGQTMSSDEALASEPVQKLKAELSAQETELANLTSTLGPKHPRVVELKSQMAVTRKALATEIGSLTENVATQLARATDLEAKLTRAVADQRAKVLKLREVQDEGSKLQLELDSAQAVYKRAFDGYDQILFASAGNYSNVSFIGRAIPPVKASKPDKIKLFGLGILFSLLIGLICPLVYELWFNRRVRCADDIDREFGIPVLAKFDAIQGLAGAT